MSSGDALTYRFTGTPPTGLAADTTYYANIVNTWTYRLSTTPSPSFTNIDFTNPSAATNESFGKVDIFILKDEAFPQIEFQRRRSQLVRQNPDRSLVLPTPEDLILQKLIGYRMTENESQRQWRDVLGVLKLQGDRLDFEYLQKWAIELELRDLLATACVESGLEVIQNRSTTANTPRE